MSVQGNITWATQLEGDYHHTPAGRGGKAGAYLALTPRPGQGLSILFFIILYIFKYTTLLYWYPNLFMQDM